MYAGWFQLFRYSPATVRLMAQHCKPHRLVVVIVAAALLSPLLLLNQGVVVIVLAKDKKDCREHRHFFVCFVFCLFVCFEIAMHSGSFFFSPYLTAFDFLPF